MHSIIHASDIALIDEIEVFLHPPQIVGLGKILAQEIKRQLIIATHSSNIMKGFLDETQGNVRIIRLQRKENTSS
ncbi:AAA family ATPase [Commensalibacter sp. Nvir]|uniref:AAA family ATPase n=1 Tax=Commensalibacter sp. Nvir TaxID=3069817 RepID=UPI0030C87766